MNNLIKVATGAESNKIVLGKGKTVKPFCGVGNNCSIIGIGYTNEKGGICLKTTTLNLISCWRAMKILEGISTIDYKTVVNCWYVALQAEIGNACNLSTQNEAFKTIAKQEGAEKFLKLIYDTWDTIPNKETLLLMTIAVKDTGSDITSDRLFIEALNTEMI